MKTTQILLPLPQKYPTAKRVVAKNNLGIIKNMLESLRKDGFPPTSYEKFLDSVQLKEEEYILAIRSIIKRPTVFLQREVNAAFLNAYNKKLLTAWRSNLDLQFVLDPYACAKYLSSYMSKSYRGMSTLLRKTATELDRGNVAVKHKLKALGSLFVNKSEVSAQEAAFGILGLELSRFSRDHVFINTGVPEERVFLTRKRKELEELSPDNTNVVVAGLLDHYIERSTDIESMCLADYAAWYNFVGETPTKPIKSINQPILQRDGNGCIKRRTFPKVIRYRRYGEKKDFPNYCREQIMLFIPWRDEANDVCGAPVRIYAVNKVKIVKKLNEYDAFCQEEKSIEDIFQEQEEQDDLECDWERELDSENNGVGLTDQGIFEEKDQTIRERFNLPSLIPESDFKSLITTLNLKQRDYVLHILHTVKERTQVLEYLSGGAGVGKSTTVKAIVQTVTRYVFSQPGARLDGLIVLLCAPTGIAAFSIDGTTLHSTFILPFNQKSYYGASGTKELRPLSENVRTELASRLLAVKIIFCDELSMVSNQQLVFINERLQQLFRTKGDLWQLPPIGAGYIFTPLKNDIGSLAGTTLWDKFKFYELTEVMRQAGDPALATALKNMATGVMTESDILLIRSRQTCDSINPPEGAVWLYYRRTDVKIHNEAALSKIKTAGFKSIANDVIEGRGKLDDDSRKQLLEKAQALHFQEAQGLPATLDLKPSIRYMVTLNIQTNDGLTNGAIGVLKHVTCKKVGENGNQPIPSIAWLLFPNLKTGARTRSQFKGFKPEFIDDAWTPITVESRIIVSWEGRNIRVVRFQFPLTPAEAITIHKSQSLGFAQMVLAVHCGISRSLLYVGCSRAKTTNGLWIHGNFVPPKPVTSSDPVFQAYAALKTRPVLLSHLPTPAPSSGMKSFLFYNIEHYMPHKTELDGLISSLRPDIITLVETYTWSNQQLQVADYEPIHRIDLDASDSDY